MSVRDFTTADGTLVLCENLVKIYKVADLEVVALQGLDLRVDRAEVIAVVGTSGSGKSTLQNILGGLDTPTAGKANVGGHDLAALRPRERTTYRRRVVGFVWQQTSRNLLPYLNVTQNVAFGNSFAQSLDQSEIFTPVEQHWHHVIAVEAEAWF